MARRIVAFVVLALLLAAALLYSQRPPGPLKVSGFIEADEVRLGSRVGGRVARVAVEEGARVAAGAVLVELEPYDLAERLAQAKGERNARQAELDRLAAGFRPEERAQAQARLDQASANLEKLENGPRPQEIAAGEAHLRLANAQLDLAQAEHTRVANLVERDAVTTQELDQAVKELKVAQENVRVREEELNQLREGTRAEDLRAAEALHEEARQALLLSENGYRVEEVDAARAALHAAEAAVRAIEAQLAELTVRAPVAGIVDAVELQPGDLVAANAPAVTIVDAAHLWVRAYVPENRLGIEIGRRVAIGVDSFPDERFAGEVTFISQQAEFTPGNVQTPEERSKQVFRIKVEVRSGLDRLRPGMAADVWLEDEAPGPSGANGATVRAP
jgi:multidrug resistance efflux pump